MANQVYANNASAVLASGITDSATTITVASGQGASFPTVSGGNWAYITLVDTSGNLEIVKCTSHLPASDSFSCTRGQDGTTARAFSANDLFELRVTKATLDTLRDIMSSTSGSASGLESITFATSGSGPCLNTSSTGSTRKILSNTGSGSYYAMGTSPYVMFKTGISFTDNTSAEPGTAVFSMSASTVACSATTFTAQAITASGAVTGTRFIPSGSTVPTNGLYLPSANTIGWSTNSALRGVIGPNGNFGLGVTPNASWANNSAIQFGTSGYLTNASGGYTAVGTNAYFTTSSLGGGKFLGTGYATCYQTDTTAGRHYFYSSSASGTVGNTITWKNLLNFSDGTTISLQNATQSVAGTGITFPATQSASTDANTLDDYEEGDWVPTISLSSGSCAIDSGIQAHYTKVGRLVTVTFWFSITSASSPVLSGIGSLPFTHGEASGGHSYAKIPVTVQASGTNYLCPSFLPFTGTSLTISTTLYDGSGTLPTLANGDTISAKFSYMA